MNTVTLPSISRIQGTDGIRRPVALSTDPAVIGATPLEAFLDRGFMTEQLVEMYVFAYVSGLRAGAEVVVGWDPRDPEGHFTNAAVRGVRKAGATALVVGILPTPGVALYHIWRGADASVVITASHNFRDQNGVKIFQGPRALKMFPDDDRNLTRRVVEIGYESDVAPLAPTGVYVDVSRKAREVFIDFHLDPRNSWLQEDENLGDFPLIVDPACGALTGIASEVLGRLHNGEVIEVNGDTGSGDVNRNSGVVDLEGVSEISRDDIRFAENLTVREVFERRGKAAVFDADGDRFYRLDYDHDSDKILVLSGDETAVLQARHWAPPPANTTFVNTVESDLNAAREARRLGYTPILTGVGDKWVARYADLDPERYGIGSEESGHTVSGGTIDTRTGEEVPVFLGNGLKSAINTLVATRGMEASASAHPFEPGFKRSFYVYYTRQQLLARGSDAFWGAARVIEDACQMGPVEMLSFEEEPDMLYMSIGDGSGGQRAGVFVRNSGTELKTGVSVRGCLEDKAEFTAIGEAAVLYLAETMKDNDYPMAQAEREILEVLENGPVPSAELPIRKNVNQERLLVELASREKVIKLTEKGYERTPLGSRMLERWS